MAVRTGTLIVAIATICSAASAPADDSAPIAHGAVDDWYLYGAPEIAIYAHTGKGNSSSTQITGPRVVPPNSQFGDLGTAISDPERSRELVASFLAGGTFGVATPAIDVPGRPRLFLDLNVSAAQTTETQLARRGSPGQLAFPRGARPSTAVGEGAMIGVGTQISVQHQGPQVHAGIGVSFEFPIGDEELIRIRPAAVYSRTILDIKAQVLRAVRLNQDFGNAQQLDDFRTIALQDERTEVYHASGPSLEVEYIPGLEWGPFAISVFARGHASHIFNSLKTEMQQCNTAGGQPNECMYWKYTQDEWAYRASLGVHMTWVPRPLW